MNNRNKYLVIITYLLAFSAITNARGRDDDWSIGDVVRKRK